MAKLKKYPGSYAQVPNFLLQDRRISFRAKGLWAYMQSLPEDWDFSIERISKESPKEGEDAVRTAVKELEACQYLKREKTQDPKTGYWDLTYYLLEGNPNPVLPWTVNPAQDCPGPVDPGTIKETEDKQTETKETETHVALATAPTAVTAYGNSQVNDVIAKIRAACQSLGYAYNKTDDRRAAHNLAVGKDFAAAASSHGVTPAQFAGEIVRLSSQSDFWAGKVTGPLSIRKHWTTVYNAGKKEFKKKAVELATGVKSYDF